MRWFALLLCVLATPAYAQVDYPPSVTSDQLNAAMATKCDPMMVVPPPETVGGTTGTGNKCRLADSAQPRITRAVFATTDSSGNFAVTWLQPLSAPPTISLTWVNTTAQPYSCELTADPTATTVQGRCKASQTTSLNLSGVTAGLNLNPFGGGVVGVKVHVIALPVTQ